MNGIITDAYKKIDGGLIGFYMPIMAEFSGQARIYGDILPNCGPLLFINQNKQRYVTGATVSFTYQVAEQSGTTTEYVNDIPYEQKLFSGIDTIYSGTVSIDADMREYSQQIFTGHMHIRNIKSLSVDDTTQEVRVYCLADDGARILYGQHTEALRNLTEIMSEGVWVAPPPCILCGGDGVYAGEVCPDCEGYAHVGRHAQQWLLQKRCEDVGIKQRTESEEALQLRGWARKWWVVPTKSEVKRYVGNFLNIDTGLITVEENYSPEAYFIVRLPFSIQGERVVGDNISLSGYTIQEIMNDISPAGTRGFIQGFYLFGDESAIHDYCHDFSTGTHETFVEPWYGFHFPSILDNWQNSRWGSDWGELYYWDYPDKYFQPSGGLAYITNTGLYSGATLVASETSFYSGLSQDDIEKIMDADSPWSGVGFTVV